jgi:hypothetical protein
VKKNDPARKANDFFPTPPIATFILTKFSDVPKNVIEPCAGRGNISIELQRNGHQVSSSDMFAYDNSLVPIRTGQDVMELRRPFCFNALVTNPPYHKDLPMKIALKGIAEYQYTALLLRLTFLEGKKRSAMFNGCKPSQIIFFSDRLNFGSEMVEPVERTDQFGGMIAYAWYVFDHRADPLDNTKCEWVIAENHYDEWRAQYDKTK